MYILIYMLLHATIYVSTTICYMLCCYICVSSLYAVCSYIHIFFLLIYILYATAYCYICVSSLYAHIYVESAHIYMLGRSSRTCICFFTHLYALCYCMLLYMRLLTYMLCAHIYIYIYIYTHLYASACCYICVSSHICDVLSYICDAGALEPVLLRH